MADNKYGKYVMREPWGIPNPANTDPDQPVYVGINQKGLAEGWDEPFTQVLRPVYRPYLMIPEPHSHNCAEYLYFIGGNPMDFRDFGAEIEFVIGEGDSAETYTITSTTWVYIPKDLPHCPLNFKRVDRPIMFGHVMFAPGFASTTSFDPDKPRSGPESTRTSFHLEARRQAGAGGRSKEIVDAEEVGLSADLSTVLDDLRAIRAF